MTLTILACILSAFSGALAGGWIVHRLYAQAIKTRTDELQEVLDSLPS